MEPVDQQQPADEPSPNPTISRITSIAWIDPMSPVSAPSTPASEQVGTIPAGGFSGNRQR